jgi:Tol biopolymer transport system component
MHTSARLAIVAVVACAIATSGPTTSSGSNRPMMASTPTANQVSATTPGKNGRIAFRRYFDANQSWGAVFTIGANGKHTKQITQPPKGVVDDQPAWAPDGSLITFTRCAPGALCHVFVVAPNDASLAPLGALCPTAANEQTCPDDAHASFSPDSKQIALVQSTGTIKQDSTGEQWIEHSALTLVNRDGSGRHVIYQSSAFSGDLDLPVFSPDGKQLVFERRNSGFSHPAKKRAIFIVNADGSNPRQLTPWAQNDGDNPDWSPDGKWILFRSYVDDPNPNHQSQILLIHPDGTGRRQLTRFSNGTHVASSSFSPDGKWIVFSKGPEGGNIDLYVMRLNGTHVQRVTRSPLWDSAPAWGPR